MDISSSLNSFDGRHTQPLEELASRIADDEQAINTLFAFAASDEPKLHIAATWVLKRLQEKGQQFSTSQNNQLLSLLRKVDSWEAQLHLLQMLPELKIAKRQASPLYNRLKDFLDEEQNKFVRAWSYNGLVVIADQHTEFQDEVTQLVNTAAKEESASVKARIRNAIQNADWL